MNPADQKSDADPARRLGALAMLLVAGILAGTQLGKIAPLVGWYHEGGLSLVMIGWLTSAIGFFVALAAVPAAWLIERSGLYRSFTLSAVALALGSLVLPLFASPAAVLAARLVEALGYLAIVIATPALLAALAPDRLRAPALAIWGGFVPIGFAIADFSAAAILPQGSPQAFLLACALGFAVSAFAAALLARGLEPAAAAGEKPNPSGAFAPTLSAPVVASAAAFGFYVILSIGFFTFLPTLVAASGTILLPAGLIALTVPAGNVLTGFLVKGRGARFTTLLSVAGFALCAATAIPFLALPQPLAATAAAVIFAAAGGVIASAIFASVPMILPPGGSPSIAIGLIAQTGGLATFVGPPIAGYVIEAHGWAGYGWFLGAVSLAGLGCMAPLVGRRRAGAWQG